MIQVCIILYLMFFETCFVHVCRICQNLACGINLITHLEDADVVAGGRVSMGGLHRHTSCQHVAIPPCIDAQMFCSALSCHYERPRRKKKKNIFFAIRILSEQASWTRNIVGIKCLPRMQLTPWCYRKFICIQHTANSSAWHCHFHACHALALCPILVLKTFILTGQIIREGRRILTSPVIPHRMAKGTWPLQFRQEHLAEREIFEIRNPPKSASTTLRLLGAKLRFRQNQT